jgi:hypothetical protein
LKQQIYCCVESAGYSSKSLSIMGTVVYFILIFMFFLGIIQVAWALIQAIITRNKRVRKHFLYYFGGVGIYFLILAMIDSNYDYDYPVMAGVHFFGGAAALAIYHVYIVGLSWNLREEMPKAEAEMLENPF